MSTEATIAIIVSVLLAIGGPALVFWKASAVQGAKLTAAIAAQDERSRTAFAHQDERMRSAIEKLVDRDTQIERSWREAVEALRAYLGETSRDLQREQRRKKRLIQRLDKAVGEIKTRLEQHINDEEHEFSAIQKDIAYLRELAMSFPRKDKEAA